MDISSIIAANIAARMKRKKLKAVDVAAKLNCTRSYVSQILSGTSKPGLRAAERFAGVLDCEPAELLKKA